MAYVLDNNVQCTLNTAINTVVTSIIVNAAVAPNKNPVAPTGGNTGVITLMDSLVSPTLIEIVTYTTSTNNGNGTFTLTGCARGQEGTTASSFVSGAACVGALTAAILAALVPTGNSTLLQFCGDGQAGGYTGPNGTTLTLVADTYLQSLTLSGTGKVNTAGFALYVAGVCDLTAAGVGAIYATPGSAGTVGAVGGAAGGAGAVTVSVPPGSNGGTGGAASGAGSNGISPLSSFGGSGGAGGKPAGGPAQGLGANPINLIAPSRPGMALIFPNNGVMNTMYGGLGGGGGSANAAQGGGGGGGGGGALIFYAGTIATSVSTPAGVIQAGTGGAGGNGFNGGGGGGGGGGGPVIVGYGSRIGPVIVNGISTTGGLGGTGGVLLSVGGGAGNIEVFNLLLGTGVEYLPFGPGGRAGAVGNANL